MNKIYAGIGSRNTPIYIFEYMTKIGKLLATIEYTLRSGAAKGADTAFEKGALLVTDSKKEIYLPCKGFENNDSPYYNIIPEAYKLAEKYHPFWNNLTSGAKKLHARNSYQILGLNLDTPCDFVICYHLGKGGTIQACNIAESYNIPIINMRSVNWSSKLYNYIKDTLGDISQHPLFDAEKELIKFSEVKIDEQES
jgi:hypothetical protein